MTSLATITSVPISNWDEVFVWNSTPRAWDDAKAEWAHQNVLVVELDGAQMRTEKDIYSLFSRAFQFPTYFGWNANAFDDVMTDLDWLPNYVGYIVSITNAEQVMADDQEDYGLAWFVRRLAFVRRAWAQLLAPGHEWTRDPRFFSAVIRGEEGEGSALTV